jgi:hypothetical protein
VGAHDAKSGLELQLSDVRAALTTPDESDPNVSMAKGFLEQHGLTLHYVREINNPKALFNRRAGTCLLRLAIKTETTTQLIMNSLNATIKFCHAKFFFERISLNHYALHKRIGQLSIMWCRHQFSI